MGLKPRKKLDCPKCSKTFKTNSDLRRHLVTHDPDAKMKCEVCGKVPKNPVALAAHIRRMHTNRARPNCDLCHRSFCHSRYLQRHMDIMHGSRARSRVACRFPGCEKTYLSQESVSHHVKTEHSQNPVQFPCTLCGKEFKRRKHLQGHIFTHTTEKPFKCAAATCGRSFSQRSNLQQHEVTHLEKSERKVFTCKLCPMTFLTSSGLRGHIQVFHENQKNHPCTFCGKRFSGSNDLKRHVQAKHPVNEEEIHFCDKCEYRSQSKRNLIAHKRRHGAKKRECYFCGKKFFTFQDLVSHCGHIHTLENK
ncbi:zinc finger protein 782-like [Folsomia candida]|uniref:zinc finger protein 782-like n=1 Tax=Folsomia candida TaxID=158441 RepID=UPI001604F623|nr:zinc finger protein 782-like [Folsomia candida]